MNYGKNEAKVEFISNVSPEEAVKLALDLISQIYVDYYGVNNFIRFCGDRNISAKAIVEKVEEKNDK